VTNGEPIFVVTVQKSIKAAAGHLDKQARMTQGRGRRDGIKEDGRGSIYEGGSRGRSLRISGKQVGEKGTFTV